MADVGVEVILAGSTASLQVGLWGDWAGTERAEASAGFRCWCQGQDLVPDFGQKMPGTGPIVPFSRRRFKWVFTWGGAPFVWFEPSAGGSDMVWGFADPGLEGMHAHTFVDDRKYAVRTVLTRVEGKRSVHTNLRETGGGETASLEALTGRVLETYSSATLGWVPKRSEVEAETRRSAQNPEEYVSYVPFELLGELLDLGSKPKWEMFEQIRVRDLLTRNDPFLLIQRGSRLALAMPIDETQMICLPVDSLHGFTNSVGDFLGADELAEIARRKLGRDLVGDSEASRAPNPSKRGRDQRKDPPPEK